MIAKNENILFPMLLNKNYSDISNIEADMVVIDHPFDFIETLKSFILY